MPLDSLNQLLLLWQLKFQLQLFVKTLFYVALLWSLGIPRPFYWRRLLKGRDRYRVVYLWFLWFFLLLKLLIWNLRWLIFSFLVVVRWWKVLIQHKMALHKMTFLLLCALLFLVWRASRATHNLFDVRFQTHILVQFAKWFPVFWVLTWDAWRAGPTPCRLRLKTFKCMLL